MVERTIAIGETSSFRYIGIEPPLGEKVVNQVTTSTILPDWVVFRTISCTQEARADAPAHTEFGFDVGHALDWLGRDTVDNGAHQVAIQIAGLLQEYGDSTLVLEGVFPTDFQTPLFGSRYYDMRDIADHFKSRREQ